MNIEFLNRSNHHKKGTKADRRKIEMNQMGTNGIGGGGKEKGQEGENSAKNVYTCM
jgi:hypothetical protein